MLPDTVSQLRAFTYSTQIITMLRGAARGGGATCLDAIQCHGQIPARLNVRNSQRSQQPQPQIGIFGLPRRTRGICRAATAHGNRLQQLQPFLHSGCGCCWLVCVGHVGVGLAAQDGLCCGMYLIHDCKPGFEERHRLQADRPKDWAELWNGAPEGVAALHVDK
jgi:hypothetical protein